MSNELKERGTAMLPRGISLFLEVPEERTCDSAGIERFNDFEFIFFFCRIFN
jgi:Protein of unknown function (DUF229)